MNCVFASRTCGASGPIDSPFVIVGESPGNTEITYGRPFIGESGDMLAAIFAKSGWDINEIRPYITNAIKCSPGKEKDQGALQRACHACRASLMAEIMSYPRKVILALGAAAAWSLTGNFKLKITQVRGQIFGSPLAEHGIVVTTHPAFLMRGGGSINKFKSDISLAVELLKGIQRTKYKPSTHVVLDTVDEFQSVMEKMNAAIHHKQGEPLEVGTDIETSGFSALEDYMLCLGFGWEDTLNYIVPEHAFKDDRYLRAIRRFMERPRDQVRFVWHNGKFDIQFFWALNIQARVDEDTMLLSYARDENRGLHDLEQVSYDAIAAPNWKAMLDQYKPKKNSSYALIPRDKLYLYAGLDVGATIQTYHAIKGYVHNDPHLVKAYRHVMVPASRTLAHIEYGGIAVDLQANAEADDRLSAELQRLKEEFDRLTMERCGTTFNMNSPIQLATLLYDVLKLEPVRFGDRGTGKDVLETFPKHPIIEVLLLYRKAAKQHGTYVKNLIDRWDYSKKTPKLIKGHVKSDGRVHASYLIHGTVTGRLASRKPNMQNPPRIPEIRGQYCASVGHILLEVDLNQAELRSLAELSGDPNLIAVYTDPSHPGIHHETSVALFGAGYTGEHKIRAKAVNFGIVYGRTGASIADEYGLPLSEGEEWIAKWARRFPIAWDFIQACREAPLRGLALVTCFGRKRRFGVINRGNVQSVGNEASNFPHQSTASDITLVAHGHILEHPTYKCRLVNLIHDAGLHDCPNDEAIIDEQVALIQYHLEAEAPKWGLHKVPFKADAKIGTHWGKLKGYKVQGQYKFEASPQFLH